jgi:hypothetical protein
LGVPYWELGRLAYKVLLLRLFELFFGVASDLGIWDGLANAALQRDSGIEHSPGEKVLSNTDLTSMMGSGKESSQTLEGG